MSWESSVYQLSTTFHNHNLLGIVKDAYVEVKPRYTQMDVFDHDLTRYMYIGTNSWKTCVKIKIYRASNTHQTQSVVILVSGNKRLSLTPEQ